MPMTMGLLIGAKYITYLGGGVATAGNSGSSITATITPPAACNLIVVGVGLRDSNGTEDCTGVTFAGSFNFTQASQIAAAANRCHSSLWYLNGPPPSTNSLVASFSGAINRFKGMSWLFFQDATGLDVSASNGNTTGAAVSNALTTTKRGIIVSSYMTQAGNGSAETGSFSNKITAIDFQDNAIGNATNAEEGIGHSALLAPGSNTVTYTPSNSVRCSMSSGLFY